MLHYTKEELEALFKERLDKLVACAGGYVHLAKMLQVTPSTVKGWVVRGRISYVGLNRQLILSHQFCNLCYNQFPPTYYKCRLTEDTAWYSTSKSISIH